MRKTAARFGPITYILLPLATLLTMLVCTCTGSVNIPLANTAEILLSTLKGLPQTDPSTASILLTVRLPRVLCVALVGASLSLSGAAMQGLLKNPLADGSTLGVSSGASLGAVLAIALNLSLPGLALSPQVIMAACFAFLSLVFVLALSWRLDRSLSTNTLILLGIVFSMFCSSILSLITTLAADRVKEITFWTMGSLADSSYDKALLLALVLTVCGIILISLSTELNAFAIDEANARTIGVDVTRVRITVLVLSSILIGACVSIGGTIGFVGLVTPHIMRMLCGPDHARLLPACTFGGATFLLLADLVARVIVAPRELPIGVVTSFCGAILFVYVFQRRGSA